ncbi:MAG: YkgJ family cysteine cluster protein [Nitrospiraceae bacterium]|nr:YkgJ family cysteine cluster protein [Nitrospiraceae bacterium]
MSKKKDEKEFDETDILVNKGKKNDKVIPVKLTGNSRFKFRCHPKVRCFTACCSNVNIALPPYDLLRLRTRLGLAADEFIKQYGEIQILDKTLFPVVTLKMRNDEKKSCPFVTPQGCTVYEDRPNICRYYPVGMATLRKVDAETGRDEFYFMTKEDHCKGFEEDKEWTIAEWRVDQGADFYDEMNRGWMEILIKKKSHGQGKPFPEIKNEMFFKMSFDTDYFRAFVFNSTFLEIYDIPAERIEKVRTDDTELLRLSYEWLRAVLFAEETLTFKEGAIEKRKDQVDKTMRKVYGQKEKGSIGELD